MHCPHCNTVNTSWARTCVNCGQPVTAGTPADDARLTRLTAATPAPLAQKIRAASHLAGERRTVTALFVSVINSTELAEQIDPEVWAAVMNDTLDRLCPVIYHYEGTIARLLGDALLAFFGSPVAHEDDPVRAVRAALDMVDEAQAYAQEVLQSHGIRFAINIGLHTGPVIVGPVDSDLRYEYTAMSDTVNLAARMQASARPMTVLASEHTYRFVAPLFDTEVVDQVRAEGGSEPVRAYRVRSASTEPGQVRGLAGLQSPIVGRDAELLVLSQLCEAVRAGLGRAVVIVGEPGLGKTRLIAEWRSRLERDHAGTATTMPQWAEAHCLSYGQELAYHLLIELVRSLTGVPVTAEEPEARATLLAFTEDLFGVDVMEVYPYLGHLLSLKLMGEALEQVRPLDPQALQTHYLAALRRLLQAMTDRGPLVLVLEDLHWADPSSTELLTRLLAVVSAMPVLLCMVTRPDRDAPGWKLVTAARETMGGSLTEISLSALSERDSRQLVANLLEIEELSDDMRALILRKAEGNPFFVEEVIRMLIDRGAIVRGDVGWVAGTEIDKVEIPDNLQGLLMARIDRLPKETKHVLRVASVIGRQFPVKVLEYVLEQGLES